MVKEVTGRGEGSHFAHRRGKLVGLRYGRVRLLAVIVGVVSRGIVPTAAVVVVIVELVRRLLLLLLLRNVILIRLCLLRLLLTLRKGLRL